MITRTVEDVSDTSIRSWLEFCVVVHQFCSWFIPVKGKKTVLERDVRVSVVSISVLVKTRRFTVQALGKGLERACVGHTGLGAAVEDLRHNATDESKLRPDFHNGGEVLDGERLW